jgi:hypothetical protein
MIRKEDSKPRVVLSLDKNHILKKEVERERAKNKIRG